jgi:glycosyltransferase involved in cell wall biosynthesis
MLIGIEAERANNPQKTGVEHYAKQLILHLAQIDSQNTYVLFLRHKPEDWFFKLPKNFKIKVIPFPIFWTQLRLSWEMLFHPVDVLFIPASALPLIHPRKSVVTIHDVAWKYFPESFTGFMRRFLEWSTKFAVDSASKIIAVSESTKKDLIKFYGTDEKKIAVVHHGFEISEKSEEKKEKRVVEDPYILFLSTLQPRKNLEGLIEAFSDLKKENPEIAHKLVVVGRPGWKFEKILESINKYKDIVVYLGHVSDEERFSVLKQADLLVLPSFYEGFGMQILEAFEMNVPVATSNVSSMPEVAGEAAVYFNPKRKDEIKNAIKTILLDRSLSERLREKGRGRLKSFSWEKCAQETLKVILDAKI